MTATLYHRVPLRKLPAVAPSAARALEDAIASWLVDQYVHECLEYCVTQFELAMYRPDSYGEDAC